MRSRTGDGPRGAVRRAAGAAAHGLRCAFYHVVAIPLLFVACKLWFGFHVVGTPRRAVAGAGGCVVVANHVHHLDCVLVALAIWPRRAVFLVDRANWDHPAIGMFMRLFECIPTGETLERLCAMARLARAVPRKGGALVVFPEGERENYRAGLAPFKPGAFNVAAAEGAPVFPVALVQNPHARGLCRLFGRPGFTVVRGAALGCEGDGGGLVRPRDGGACAPAGPAGMRPRRGRAAALEEAARAAMERMLGECGA